MAGESGKIQKDFQKKALEKRLDAAQPIAEQKSRRLRGQGGGQSLINVPDFLNEGLTPLFGQKKPAQNGSLGNKTKLGGK